MRKIATVLMGLSIGLSGCANMNQQDVGTVAGGVLGGALGNQIGGGNGRVLATVGGTLLGAYLGGSVGKSMDDIDRMKMNQALETTRTNQTVSWKNPDSGNSYAVTPTALSTNAQGLPCRDYTTTVLIGGKRQQMYGRACRMADGSWQDSGSR